VREAKEEIDIIIDKKDIELVHVMHRLASSDNDERLDFFFTCREFEGEVKNLEPKKCDDLSWFSLQELPENTIPYIRDAIENSQSKSLYSERQKFK
jgi:8-oxo-dGTP pyrophosphatase MutT (NUDIX family)